MLWPAYAFDIARNSWLWWAWVEANGRGAVTPGKKYQQERWHLRALHDIGVLNALARSLSTDLAQRHGRATVKIGSVWVDHTPQAETKYIQPAGGSPLSVKCELADLLVITYLNVAGRPSQPGDSKALLIQAKVTDNPGILDPTGGVKSSSCKERNLFECCCAPVTLWKGTIGSAKKKSAKAKVKPPPPSEIGTYDLLATPANEGLRKYSRYLTIPRKAVQPTVPAYQGMWPTARNVDNGATLSLGHTILSMLDPAVAPMQSAGYAIDDPAAHPDWPRLVGDLSDNYRSEVVNRFLGAGGGPIDRLVESATYNCFVSTDTTGNPRLSWKSELPACSHSQTTDLLGLLSNRNNGTGTPEITRGDQEIHDGMPRIPVIVVCATLDSYEERRS